MGECSKYLLVSYRPGRLCEKNPLNARLRVNIANNFNILLDEESKMRQMVVSRVSPVSIKHIHTRVEWSKWDRYSQSSSELPHSQTELRIIGAFNSESGRFEYSATVGLFGETIASYQHSCLEPFDFLSILPKVRTEAIFLSILSLSKENPTERIGFGVVPGFYIIYQGYTTLYFLNCMGKHLEVQVPSLEKRDAFDTAFARYSAQEKPDLRDIAENFLEHWEESITESLSDLVTRTKNGAMLLGSEITYHPEEKKSLSRKLRIYLDLLLEFLIWFDDRILEGEVIEWVKSKCKLLEVEIAERKKPKPPNLNPQPPKQSEEDSHSNSWQTDEEGEEEEGEEEGNGGDEDENEFEALMGLGAAPQDDPEQAAILGLERQMLNLQLIKDLKELIGLCRDIKAATEFDINEVSRTLLKIYTLVHDKVSLSRIWHEAKVPRVILGQALLFIGKRVGLIKKLETTKMMTEWGEVAGIGVISGGYLNAKMLGTQQITRKVFAVKKNEPYEVVLIKDEPADKEVGMVFFVGKSWYGEFTEEEILFRKAGQTEPYERSVGLNKPEVPNPGLIEFEPENSDDPESSSNTSNELQVPKENKSTGMQLENLGIQGTRFSLPIPVKKFKEITVISRYNDLLFFIVEPKHSYTTNKGFVVDLRPLYFNRMPIIKESFEVRFPLNSGTSIGHMKIMFSRVFVTLFSKQHGVALNIYTLDDNYQTSGEPLTIKLKELTIDKAPADMQIFDFTKIFVLKLMSTEMFSQGDFVMSGRCRKNDNAQYFGYFKWQRRQNTLEFYDIRHLPYGDILWEFGHPRITYMEHKKVPFFMMYWSSTCYKLGAFWRQKICILTKKCKILDIKNLFVIGCVLRDTLSTQPITNKFLISMTTGRYCLPKTVISVFQIELNF